MLNITLPDGNKLNFEKKVTGLEVAEKISKSLSKSALLISIDGKLKDLNTIIEKDCSVKIFTSKDKEGLETIRHDTAHVLAMAVQELFPGTQVTIGPVIEDGFYYDFARKEPFTDEDLNKIENKMRDIVERDEKTTRQVWPRKKAIDHFKKIGEIYKAEIIKSIPEGEEVSIYFHGKWHDLCRGPHLTSTGKIGKFFKLTKVSGAYWRGDSNNEMLQRVYGTSWSTQKDLDDYLKRIEEAEKRDHRKLGKLMDLFHFREESPGAVFWHEKGWTLFQKLVSYMRYKQDQAGYKEINTPEILDRSLWEKSGHWEKFKENMYIAKTKEDKNFALKPMNCPGGVQIFNNSLRSYRELPMRVAEFGKVFRFEPSGALHGLMRVREFTQDDAHIYCLREQMEDECMQIINLTLEIYKDFGFENVKIKFSDRPTKRIGDDKTWDFLEKSLINSLKKLKLSYEINTGDGAFYGPKIEFVLVDALSREWQCGTIQVDLNLPPRLNATYIDSDGGKKHPVMIHRAFFGSLERFIGILIEHYSGKLPKWLAPVQVAIATINDNCNDYCDEIAEKLQSEGFRSKKDKRNEKLNYKIREISNEKIPYLVIIGEKEVSEKTLSLREFGNNLTVNLKYEELLKKLKKSCRID